MKNLTTAVHYLYHSGFSIETEQYLLIFDYYLDQVESAEKCREFGAIGKKDLSTDKKIVIFSSHNHADHFNPVILKWAQIRPDIQYILSSDIPQQNNEIKVQYIDPYQEVQLEDLYIKAYGSTDIGVSFLVRVDGKKFFHAGDLNCWSWWDDTEQGRKKAEAWFEEEIAKIKGEKIDIAFFPVDPRLQENYSTGAKYFIEQLSPDIFIPMHFDEGYDVIAQFAEEMKAIHTKVISISERGQKFEF